MSERWKPGIEEQYYFFDMFFEACKMTNKDENYNASLFAVGNCFKTREEAEAAAEKVKALLLSLPDKKQPKLTAEVFNLPDCPEWAKWAAVDYSGIAFFYENKPIFTGTCYQSIIGATKIIDSSIKWDITNSQNSLIERPVVLPNWCRVGEWIYIPAIEEYMQIKKVEDDLLFDKEGCHIPYTDCKKARLRPYNEDAMKALVGKPITMRDGAVCLCTAYSKQCKSVIFDNMHWDAQQLMDSGCTIDDKPCGVLKHLNEKGEWVE